MAVFDIPDPLRERLREVQERLAAEKGRKRVTMAEALEYLLEQERKTVAP